MHCVFNRKITIKIENACVKKSLNSMCKRALSNIYYVFVMLLCVHKQPTTKQNSNMTGKYFLLISVRLLIYNPCIY